MGVADLGPLDSDAIAFSRLAQGIESAIAQMEAIEAPEGSERARLEHAFIEDIAKYSQAQLELQNGHYVTAPADSLPTAFPDDLRFVQLGHAGTVNGIPVNVLLVFELADAPNVADAGEAAKFASATHGRQASQEFNDLPVETRREILREHFESRESRRELMLLKRSGEIDDREFLARMSQIPKSRAPRGLYFDVDRFVAIPPK